MSLIVLLYDEHYYVDSSGVNTSEYKQQCCNQNNALVRTEGIPLFLFVEAC